MALPELIPDGVSLEHVTRLSPAQNQLLRDCWITTAQELVAIHASKEATRRVLRSALRVDQAGLDAIVTSARSVLPPTRDAGADDLVQQALRTDYGMGALLVESSDVVAERAILPLYAPSEQRSLLPASHSLLEFLPPLRSQGARATCVAHAALAVREQLEMAAGAPAQINLSEQFVYWWCKSHDGLPSVSGTYLSLGMRCLQTVGATLEEVWRYKRVKTPDQGQGPPPAAAAEGDRTFATARTLQFNRTDIHGIKTCLFEDRAVAFSVPVYDSWYKSTACLGWGKITLPLPGEPYNGGHAMNLVGYQDDETAPGGGYFLVRNSWQPWAWHGVWRSGYGYIPYAYISNHASSLFSAERINGGEPVVEGAAAPASGGLIASAPGIWLRQSPDGGGEPQSPVRARENALYVRVINPGPAHVYKVTAHFFFKPSDPGGNAPWEEAGRGSVSWLRPGATVIGPILWTPPSPGPFDFGVRLGHPGDESGEVLAMAPS